MNKVSRQLMPSNNQDREKPLPRRIADLLISRIFVGEFKPGDKLPPDRVLAEQLGVDRTSLRAALSELAGRNIIKALQGSGVVVLDYREHAGLDFLDAVFAMPDIDLGSAFNMELLDHWIEVMPAIARSALGRATHSDLAAIDLLFMEQLDLLAKGASNEELACREVELQDTLVKLAGSTILRLFANSMRKLRLQFAISFFRYGDVKEHVLTQRMWLQDLMAGCSTPEQISDRMRSYLIEKTRAQRERLSRMSSNPSRRGNRKISRASGKGDK
jgi:GntR family transcriptional regulator, transcriptional repressor for pyruvate dehydrogenase complex